MSGVQVNDLENRKKRSSATSPSSPLKINKDSYSIRKSPSGDAKGSTRTPPRHPPVIIYTHSPKVIHTNPKDFMALVQKLTGLPRSRCEDNNASTNQNSDKIDNIKRSISKKSPFIIKDNEPSDNGYGLGDGQVNQCYAPQFYDSPTASFDNMAFYNNMSSNDFFGSNTPYYNYSNSLLIMNNINSSLEPPPPGSLQEFSEF